MRYQKMGSGNIRRVIGVAEGETKTPYRSAALQEIGNAKKWRCKAFCDIPRISNNR